MASLTAASNGDGTVAVTSSGVAATANYVLIVNSTTGRTIYSGAYSSGVTATDTLPNNAVGNTYTASYYTGGSTSGTLVGTLSTGGVGDWSIPRPSVSTSGASSGCSWGAPTNNNGRYTETAVAVSYRINGGGWITYATGLSPGAGSIPSNAVYVGYNNTIEWSVAHTFASSTYGNSVSNAGTSSYTLPSAPPPPPSSPNPPTGLTAVDSGSSVALSWTAPVGGANGYEITRNSTVIGTQAGTTKTDSAPGATRPITYSVRAYNTNSSGTAYSSSVSVLVGSQDSCGILIG